MSPFLFIGILTDELEDNQVLLGTPIALPDSLIEMVLPSFTTLLGSLEELAIGEAVKLLGDLIPLSEFELSA